MLAHSVFFTLAEKTPEAQDKLIQGCHTYLKDHPGVVYFAAGARCEELAREVNDTGYDVGLIVVFDTQESHDTYQTAPDHLAFIEKCKDLWSSVRVFDTSLK